MPKDTPLVKASGGGQQSRPRSLTVAPARVSQLRQGETDKRRQQADYLLKRIDTAENDDEREFLWEMVKRINEQELAQEERSRSMPAQVQTPTGNFIAVPNAKVMPQTGQPIEFKNPYSDSNYRPEFLNQRPPATSGVTPESLLNNNPFYKYDLSK